MKKEITRVEKITNCITDMSEILETSRVSCAKELFKKVAYAGKRELTNDFNEAMLNIMIEDKSNPREVDSRCLNLLLSGNVELFRKYYNLLDEKYKVQLVSKLDNVILLFKNKNELSEDSYYGTGYSRIGTPIDFACALSRKRYHNETIDDYNEFIYNMVLENMEYFFKYIDLQKITDNRYYSIHYTLNTTDPENDYGILAIAKRISMYQQKKITTPVLTRFVEFISDSNNTSKEVRKYLMDTLNTYIPEKIMFQIMI